jgi:cell fate (sporulation/competence/biofilm development) regulator YlbF (YheA/YmcA/DUF963 family)
VKKSKLKQKHQQKQEFQEVSYGKLSKIRQTRKEVQVTLSLSLYVLF